MQFIVAALATQRDFLNLIFGGMNVSYITGPAGAVADNLVAFDGSSGLLAKDSGVSLGLITQQGNTFNGVSQLVQLTNTGILPVLDGSNLINVSNVALAVNVTPVFGATDHSGLAVDGGGKLVSAGVVLDGTFNFDATTSGAVTSMTFIYGQLVSFTTLP